jgi:hypothetical protein
VVIERKRKNQADLKEDLEKGASAPFFLRPAPCKRAGAAASSEGAWRIMIFAHRMHEQNSARFRLDDDHPSKRSRRHVSCLPRTKSKNFLAIFRSQWRHGSCRPNWCFRGSKIGFGFNQRDEKKMKQVFKLAAAPASALLALAFLSMSTPASAGEYCRTDTSGMRGCGYDTMAQCEATASGKGGAGCYRDPFLPEASNPKNALAYQPKSKSAVHHAKPVNAQ